MKLPIFIATRYTKPRKGQGVVSFISLIAIIAIALSIIMPITVLSVMNGVTSDVRDRMLAVVAHMQVSSYSHQLTENTDLSALKARPEFAGAAPYVQGNALMMLMQNYNGVLVKGIDTSAETSVSDVIANVPKADLDLLKPRQFNILVGKKLADRYGLMRGDKVKLLVPQISVTVAGVQPRIKRFTIAGFFDAGHYTYDVGQAYINIDDAKTLFSTKGQVNGFQIKLKDALVAPRLANEINANQALGESLYVSDWSQQNPAYFDAVKAEKAMMFMILMIIVLVAMVNILSIIYMVVQDKQRDIAILRTMGMQRKSIMATFLYQGTFLGIIGTTLGVILGLLISYNLPLLFDFAENNFNFRLPEEMYFISELRPKIDPIIVVVIAVTSVVLSMLATLVPAYKATNVQPAQALSYD